MTDDPEMFGLAGPPTLEEFLRWASSSICQADQPHVDAEKWPAGDHGHTFCYFVGGLLALVNARRAWMADAMQEMEDINAQFGDDGVYRKHNQQLFMELMEGLHRLNSTTF